MVIFADLNASHIMNSKKKYIKKVVVIDPKSSPEARAERLRKVRNMANLSREAMCAHDNLNINTYKGWEIARYGGLPVDGAERVVARVAQEGVVCTVDWLLHEIGVGPHVVPDYQKAQHDQQQPTTIVQLNNEEQLIINELLLFRKQFSNTINFEVEDDGVSPLYQRGDIVAGIKRHSDRIHEVVGQVCIVQTQDGKTLVRHVREGELPGKYTLTCTNLNTSVKKPIMYDVTLASAAPIIRYYRRA